MDAQTIETGRTLCCSACSVERGCACDAPPVYLSFQEQRELRRKRAAELYKSGLSMQQIADQLKVAVNTISEDLVNFPETGKIKQPKTKKNPKGAGRPKGSKTKRPGVKQAQRAVDAAPEDWQRFKAKAEAEGKSAAEMLGDLLADPVIDPKTLPKTAQEKLAAALRQQQRVQNIEFEKRVATEYRARFEKAFPDLEKTEREARELKRAYEQYLRESKKMGTASDWNNLMICLHPDTRRTASDAKFDAAFRWVQSKKFAITGEK